MSAGQETSAEQLAAGVYAEHYRELVRFLQRLCTDKAQAEDVAQDAGMRLIATMQRETVTNPKAFLFHVATNLARDQLRRRITEQEHAQDQGEAELSPGADHVAAVREEVAIVARAMRALPKRAREVLQLSRIEGYSQKEVAARLDVTTKTVENHLTRALALLTSRLRRGGRQ